MNSQLRCRGIVHTVRKLGGIIFLTVYYGKENHSLVCKRHSTPQAFETCSLLKKGDYIEVACEKTDGDFCITQVARHAVGSFSGSLLHQTQQGLLRAKSAVLMHIRQSLDTNGFLEFTPPSIHCGMTKGDVFSVDFFGKPARLSSSNALFLDAAALKLGPVYSLQTCFRAEPSRTSTHLAEFLMLEIALPGTNYDDLINFIEQFLHSLLERIVLTLPITESAMLATHQPFKRMRYADISGLANASTLALRIAEKSLVQNEPLFITHMPIKRASWRAKRANPQESLAFNLLLPEVGEVAEGCERQMNAEEFKKKIILAGVEEQLRWLYNEMQTSTCGVSGAGIGVDRLIMWMLGLKNIRLLQPFYRDQSFAELTRTPQP